MTGRKDVVTAAPFAYEGLHRVIHERARLSILTSLVTHQHGLSFVELKQMCALTDGNLARHLEVLEEDNMIKVTKGANAGRAQTIARITASGRTRYLEYLGVLEQIVRDAASAKRQSAADGVRRKLFPLET